MAALHSLQPEERADVKTELATARAYHDRVTANLATMQLNRAPQSYIGKVRAQLRANSRHITRLERLLEEAAT